MGKKQSVGPVEQVFLFFLAFFSPKNNLYKIQQQPKVGKWKEECQIVGKCFSIQNKKHSHSHIIEVAQFFLKSVFSHAV